MAVHFADPAAEHFQRRLVGEHGVGDETREADIVAPDRQHDEIDLARAVRRTFAQHQPALELGDDAVHVVGFGKVEILRLVLAAHRLGGS